MTQDFQIHQHVLIEISQWNVGLKTEYSDPTLNKDDSNDGRSLWVHGQTKLHRLSDTETFCEIEFLRGVSEEPLPLGGIGIATLSSPHSPEEFLLFGASLLFFARILLPPPLWADLWNRPFMSLSKSRIGLDVPLIAAEPRQVQIEMNKAMPIFSSSILFASN